MATSRDELQQQLSQSHPEQEQYVGMQSEPIPIPVEITLDDYLAIKEQQSILYGESESARSITLSRVLYYVKMECTETDKSYLIKEYHKTVDSIIAFLNRDMALMRHFASTVIVALNKSNVYREFISRQVPIYDTGSLEQCPAFLPQYAALAPQVQAIAEPLAAAPTTVAEVQPYISNFTASNIANNL